MDIKVMSIDPGQTTGYTYADIDVKSGRVLFYPFQMVDDVDECFARIRAFQPRYIIMEDFEFRQRSRAGLVLFSVQLIGVARLYTFQCKHQCAIYLQKAAQGKSYYTDSVLKSINCYQRGVPHGMDATRHLLQWLTFGVGNQYITSKSRDFAEIVEKEYFRKLTNYAII